MELEGVAGWLGGEGDGVDAQGLGRSFEEVAGLRRVRDIEGACG
jgi:hypothetical protein